jgi:hypothetical protein
MKQLTLILILSAVTLSSKAQTQLGTTTINKIPQSSVLFELPYSEEAVSNALNNVMGAFGKPKKSKDFVVYKNIRIIEISDAPITYYFSVEKKSRRDRNNALLTMLMANEAEHFYSSADTMGLFLKAKDFLNAMESSVAAASLELQIQEQDELVKKTDKKLKNLRDDGIDYIKQRKKLEEKISDNIKDVENTQTELARRQVELELLIKKRKRNT